MQHDGSKEYSSSTAPVFFLRVMSYKYVDVHVVVVVADCGHRRRRQMLLLLLMMLNAVVVVVVEC